MGILNTRGRFFIPALASSFFKPWFNNRRHLTLLHSTRIRLPAHCRNGLRHAHRRLFLQLGVQLPALLKTGFQFTPRINLRDSGLLRILKLMIPATIGLSATQINIFIGTPFCFFLCGRICVMGSIMHSGSFSCRSVCSGWLFSIAALPVLARYAAQKKLCRDEGDIRFLAYHGFLPDLSGNTRAHHPG